MPETRVGKKCVVDCIPTTKDVVCNVCSYVMEKKTGVRTVCDYVTEAVKKTVKVCTMVPYTETISVPECPVAACATTCDTCAADCGHKRHGLFSRKGGCCN
jgi:hypothetical protein